MRAASEAYRGVFRTGGIGDFQHNAPLTLPPIVPYTNTPELAICPTRHCLPGRQQYQRLTPRCYARGHFSGPLQTRRLEAAHFATAMLHMLLYIFT